jgi:hypothetical protein
VARRLWKLLFDYWDLLLAAIGAAVIAGLGLADALKRDHLTEATLGVLAVVSATLVRDRWRRDRIGEAVTAVTAKLNASVPQEAWRLLEAEFTWDIQARGTAKTTSRRVLEFLTGDIVAIHEWTSADGKEEAYECVGGPPGGAKWPLIEGEKIGSGTPGSPARVLQLGGMAHRGQTFEVITSRTLIDTFPKGQERVNIAIGRPTEKAVLKIIWPTNRPPKSVNVMINDRPAGDLTPSLRTAEGRKKLEWPAPDPQVRDDYVISWDWD